MARYMGKITFTAPRVETFILPEGKSQAFLWDSEVIGLGLRATKGAKAYVYQSLYAGKTIRITIGSVRDYLIPEARKRARELQQEIDRGIDPRQSKAATIAKAKAERDRQQEQSAIVGDVWRQYINERKQKWSALHLRDHEAATQADGLKRKRSPELTQAGVLYPLMKMRLADVTPEVVTALMAKEGKARPTRAQLALRLFKAFMRWAASEPAYSSVANPLAVSSKAVEEVGKPKAKDDVLLAEQLKDWFAIVGGIQSPVISAYVQCLLLTGARREELMALKWSDINTKWQSLTIRDKDNSKNGKDGTRTIPLTPYVSSLLAKLPRRGTWVFSSATSADGRLVAPYKAHASACKAIGLKVSLHGLRRSFGSLAEWLEIPAGVIAQIQGHKPSATAEKHYRVRPLDLLRVHHTKYEAWILERAGLQVPTEAMGEGVALRLLK